MNIPAVKYLHWAKTRTRVKYDLAGSGVPQVGWAELGISPDDVSLGVEGTYGHPELIARLSDRYGVDRSCILPVPGTSAANFIALACVVERSRPVLIEAPAYEPLIRAAAFHGAEILRFGRPPGNDFAPDLAEMERGLNRGAKAVVLTDLHNPSGRRLDRRLVSDVADLCHKHDAYLIVDEVYLDFAHINRGEPLATSARLGDHVITTNSLTKVYGLGGIRAGWIFAADTIIDRARNLMDHISVDHPAPSASVAIFALKHIDRLADRTRRIYQKGFRIFDEWITSTSRLRRFGNHGAIFEWLKLPDGVQSDELCHRLAAEHDVQVAPGSYFDSPSFIRLCFALPEPDLHEALRRINLALTSRAGQ